MVQFTEGLMAHVRANDRVHFEATAPNPTDQLTGFYTRSLAITKTSILPFLPEIAGEGLG